jgi:hypothetical protein
MTHAAVSLAWLAITVWSLPAEAQADPDRPPPTLIILRPAAAPVPALKYRILPERHNLVPGNAAIFYHRAIELTMEQRLQAQVAKDRKDASSADDRTAADWSIAPLNAIPREQAHRWLDANRAALHEITLGARRQTCNWEFEQREEGIGLLVEEIQFMRSLGRLVAIASRVAVLDGRLDDAVDSLQTGFAMARHVSDGPSLYQGLVGLALASAMIKPLEDLVQAHETPSLYWALADRSRPMIDLSKAIDAERLTLEHEIPRLRDLDGPPWSQAQATEFSDDLRTKLFKLAGMVPSPPAEPGAHNVNSWTLKLGMAGLVAQVYPEAKQALIAHGRPAQQVEAMPVVQVSALHTFQKYQQIRDDIFKWSSLPYYQAVEGMDSADLRNRVRAQNKLLLKLFTMVVPSVRGVLLSRTMLERRLDAVQCIEAIRLHAAVTGKLPSRLDEISAAPVPADPMSGKPFEYRVDGDRAFLSSAYPPGGPKTPQYMIEYELKWSP